jgi:hypothetical protein
VIRDSGIKFKGTTYNKSTHILVYAADIVPVWRAIDALKDSEEIKESSRGNGTYSQHTEAKICGSNQKNQLILKC